MRKDSLKILILIFLVLIFAGCDQLYRLVHKEGAEEKELLGDMDILANNEKTKDVQQLLKIYGYTVGKIDGKMGPNTREAIKKFQEDNELPVTRFVDRATWEKLNSFEEPGLMVNNQLNPKAIQQALIRAGFYQGPADGKIGPKTKQAIKNFQKDKGLKSDGIIGLKTLKELAVYLEAPAPSP